MREGTIQERLIWWLMMRVWRPLRRRCSWCGSKIVPRHDDRVGDGEHDERGCYLGCGAWACQGCIEYGEG